MEWISVKDRLPEPDDNNTYLAIIGNPCHWNFPKYEIVRFNKWGWHYGTKDTQNTVSVVTFWMPLPKPPME